MLWLYIEAPFAVCRTFTAGWYRPTATFLTPSAAYGLILNIAGVESRLREGEKGHDGKTPSSLIRSGLPTLKLALGVPAIGKCDQDAFPRMQSMYQQLHRYKVGKGDRVEDPENPGKKVYSAVISARRAFGSKPDITPVRREFLSDLRAIIGIDADAEFLDRVRRGLDGEFPRYGVPFLGDNNFLLDRAEIKSEPGSACWFIPITDADAGPQERTARLTIQIDRADLSKTTSKLFAPTEKPESRPPASAWIPILGR